MFILLICMTEAKKKKMQEQFRDCLLPGKPCNVSSEPKQYGTTYISEK